MKGSFFELFVSQINNLKQEPLHQPNNIILLHPELCHNKSVSITFKYKSNFGSRFIFRTPKEDDVKNLSRFLGRSEVISTGQLYLSRTETLENFSISSEEIRDVLISFCKENKLTFHIGNIASGSAFISSNKLKKRLLIILTRLW